MAIGFRTSGMFGRMSPTRSPWETPGYGDGILQRQNEMQQPKPNAMPIGVQQMQQPAKPKFFGEGGVGRAIAGNIGDFLLQQSGMDPIYMPNMLQQRDMAERARMADQKRMQDREDMQWEWQNKPKDVNPYRWKANDGSLMELGPDGQPRQVYKDPNKRLEYRQGPDGRFYPIDTADAPLQPVTDDEWNSASPMGGSGGNVTGGFR